MDTYKRHRFPAAVISYAVWLYYRFNFSHRDIEDLLAERGIIVSYEIFGVVILFAHYRLQYLWHGCRFRDRTHWRYLHLLRKIFAAFAVKFAAYGQTHTLLYQLKS